MIYVGRSESVGEVCLHLSQVWEDGNVRVHSPLLTEAGFSLQAVQSCVTQIPSGMLYCYSASSLTEFLSKAGTTVVVQ